MDGVTRQMQKAFSRELFAAWAESWGLSLAFAVTQSVDESEKIVSEAIVALVARKTNSRHTLALDDAERELEPADFAAAIWQIGASKSFRGFGADSFFKLPVLTRAVVMLKLRAKFSRAQIAEALDLPVDQIETHLESARLVHTSGHAWLAETFEGCKQWERIYEIPHRYVRKATGRSDFLQEVFDRYVGNDLDSKTTENLHAHLTDCESCRAGFVHFRRTYSDWVTTIPVVEPDSLLRKHLDGVSRVAARRLTGRPSPWAPLAAASRDWQFRAIMLILALGLAYFFFRK